MPRRPAARTISPEEPHDPAPPRQNAPGGAIHRTRDGESPRHDDPRRDDHARGSQGGHYPGNHPGGDHAASGNGASPDRINPDNRHDGERRGPRTTRPVVHIVAGPTAGGKSAYALRQALAQDGVIINADSMQIYDALPILTAAPDAQDRAQVPHRLYNVLPPGERCSAARWCAMAHEEIAAALRAGRTPFIVGGTGFYIRALTEGLAPIPDIPPAIRADAVRTQARLGNPAFHAALAARDPVMAARLQPQDTQRLIRAWEVHAATGRSLAAWQEEPPAPPPARYDYRVTLIMPDRAALYDRCNRRFDAMMAAGALEETAAFAQGIDRGDVPEDAPVTGALGFHPLRAFLRGESGREDAVARAQADTRHYAKRQVTWFRHQIRAHTVLA